MEDPMFMNNDFSEQPQNQTVGVLPSRRPADYQELRSNDPAAHAMTDFTSKFAITVSPDRQIDAALADMVRLSVRAMLVMRADSIIGLITSYDIEGPRPARFAERPQVIRREEITVGDIMTEWEDLPALDWSTVQTARISDLLEIFEGMRVMHLLVVESDDRGADVVRGLISRSRIERHLQVTELLPHMAGDSIRTNQNEETVTVSCGPSAAG
jgi:CBS domain-containing protein